MIEKQNFRYRGPIESRKVDNMIKQTVSATNYVIAKAQELINKTEQISQQLIADTKRRGVL